MAGLSADRPSEVVLAARVARQFYLEGVSKVDIADRLGISRFRVARLLDSARDAGMVRIEIGLPLERAEVVAPDRLKGSWAGAFGPTQFMPTAFKRYAVDGDGDGRRDVVDNVSDLIASTANNLKKDGWQSGAS